MNGKYLHLTYLVSQKKKVYYLPLSYCNWKYFAYFLKLCFLLMLILNQGEMGCTILGARSYGVSRPKNFLQLLSKDLIFMNEK
jgi:hypothetical protein